MNATTGRSSVWNHVLFASDCMLFTLALGGLIVGALVAAFAPMGGGGIGLVLGVLAAPAVALLLAWTLRGRPASAAMGVEIAIGVAIVAVIAAGIYGVVVGFALDSGEALSATVLTVLAFEAVLVVALLVDAVVDLASARAHRGLDLIRIALVVPIVAAGMLTATNPDVGELLVFAGPLALAGLVAGVVGDAAAAVRTRSAEGRNPHAPTPAH